MDSNLKLTLETENYKSLNYLDLNISKTNSEIPYNIYKKSHYRQNNTGLIINTYFIYRRLSTTMIPDSCEKRQNTIKYIDLDNGYNTTRENKLNLNKTCKNP